MKKKDINNLLDLVELGIKIKRKCKLPANVFISVTLSGGIIERIVTEMTTHGIRYIYSRQSPKTDGSIGPYFYTFCILGIGFKLFSPDPIGNIKD